MLYLAFQIVLLLSIALLVGVWVGGWVAKWRYDREVAGCLTELAGLRRNYHDVTVENANLRSKTRQLEKILRKISTPPVDSEYGQFLELRKTLEKTRSEYQTLLTQCHQQEKTLADLRIELQCNQQVSTRLQTTSATSRVLAIAPATANSQRPEVSKHDDLTRIQGISQQLASQLKALGIVTYRQVAEFTSDDMLRIQRIIGSDLYQPPEGWAQNARALLC